jgi:hypothetical protein
LHLRFIETNSRICLAFYAFLNVHNQTKMHNTISDDFVNLRSWKLVYLYVQLKRMDQFLLNCLTTLLYFVYTSHSIQFSTLYFLWTRFPLKKKNIRFILFNHHLLNTFHCADVSLKNRRTANHGMHHYSIMSLSLLFCVCTVYIIKITVQ